MFKHTTYSPKPWTLSVTGAPRRTRWCGCPMTVILGTGVSPWDTRAIISLDLKSAFDNVAHHPIVSGLTAITLFQEPITTYKSFSSPSVRLTIADFKTNPILLRNVGTPQGSVLSPLIVNLAMWRLPTALAQIPNLWHSLYADDITLWTAGGSDGDIQDALQARIRSLERYGNSKVLQCPPQESQQLVIYKWRHAPYVIRAMIYTLTREQPYLRFQFFRYWGFTFKRMVSTPKPSAPRCPHRPRRSHAQMGA